MYNRGYYSYKSDNKDIKTLYTIEYTRDKKVFDIMDKKEFAFDMLEKNILIFWRMQSVFGIAFIMTKLFCMSCYLNKLY